MGCRDKKTYWRRRACIRAYFQLVSLSLTHRSLKSLKLLIIDEVHLLNDERGAVIETIVARTLRQVKFEVLQ
jgi:superfamily II helicase